MSDQEKVSGTELKAQIFLALNSGWTQSEITKLTREIQTSLQRENHSHPFGFNQADFTLSQQLASGVPQCYISWGNSRPTGSMRGTIRRLRDHIGVRNSEEMYFAFRDRGVPLLPISWKPPKSPLVSAQIALLQQLWSVDSITDLARAGGIPPTNLHGRVSDLMKKLGLRSRIELARYWKEVLEPTLQQG